MRKKEISEIIIIGILIIIFLFLVFGKKKKQLPEKALQSKRYTPAELVIMKEKENAGLYFRLEQRAKNIDLIRDPFSKKKFAARQEADLIGIAWDPKTPLAIVDGEVVAIGDQVNDKTIVDIKKDRIVINDGEKDIVIMYEM